MVCLSSELRTTYQERHDRYELQLIDASAYLDAMLAGEGFESFKFDSGESMTWAKFQDPDKLRKLIRFLESQVDHYRNKLNGTGIVRLNLRRR